MAGDASDGELVELALTGRQDALAALFNRHRDGVYRIVRAQIGDGAEALDITQESFVAAFQALSRFDRTRPLRPWLARIAINKCRDWTRRRAVRRFFTRARPLDDAIQVADDAALPDRVAEDREALKRLQASLLLLPASLREPLILCAIESLSRAEAAEILGVTEKAVEMRLYRARARLSELLRDDAGPPV